MDNTILLMKLQDGWVTREDLRAMLGGASDRKARQYIEDLNAELMKSGRCIISTSSRPGYHIPNPLIPEDMETVRQASAELKSKAVSIFERRQVLEAFLTNPIGTPIKSAQLNLFD